MDSFRKSAEKACILGGVNLTCWIVFFGVGGRILCVKSFVYPTEHFFFSIYMFSLDESLKLYRRGSGTPGELFVIKVQLLTVVTKSSSYMCPRSISDIYWFIKKKDLPVTLIYFFFDDFFSKIFKRFFIAWPSIPSPRLGYKLVVI